MSPYARARTTAVGVVVLVVGVATASLAARPGPPPGGGGGPPTFEVTGSVAGLHPGVVRSLTVRVENPFSFPVVVDGLGVTVGDASGACPASALEIAPLPSPVTIQAGEDLAIEVDARLRADAPDACQGALFPLTYAAVAGR